MSINKAILLGYVGNNPEFKQLTNGRVATFSLATSESWRDRNSGERKERAEWHSVVIFNDNLIKVVEQYVKKGALLYLEGQLQTRKWQDQNGNDRYKTEIVLGNFNSVLQMLNNKQSDKRSASSNVNSYAAQSSSYSNERTNGNVIDDFDDDHIPF